MKTLFATFLALLLSSVACGQIPVHNLCEAVAKTTMWFEQLYKNDGSFSLLGKDFNEGWFVIEGDVYVNSTNKEERAAIAVYYSQHNLIYLIDVKTHSKALLDQMVKGLICEDVGYVKKKYSTSTKADPQTDKLSYILKIWGE